MPWLVLALAAALAGGWYAFTHRMQPVAIVLLAVALGLAFLIGRAVEGGRDAAWQQAASRLHGTFLAQPGADLLRAFGQPAPWDGWGRDGAPHCARAIDGRGADPPFALLHVRYPVREARGEETQEQWRDVTLAAVRLPRRAGAASLQQVDAGAPYETARNGEWLFLWKKPGPGAGEPAAGDELAQLLQQALQLARRP